jgi:SPP1 gp7 family putative phage head morphogenesis protein
MKRDYKQKYRGTRNAGGLMITTGGAKIDKLSFSQKEMEYLSGRKWTRDEIFTVFGVPTTFSDVSAVSRANADSANTEYQRRTIKPKLIMTEDTINDQLVSDFDESLFVAFDENVPVDEEFRLKERASNIQVGYTSVNEERIRDGLDPIEDGDEHRNPNVSANVSIDGPAKRVKRFPSLGMPAANFIPENFVEAVQKYLKRFGDSILDQAKESEFKNVKIGNPDDIVSSWFDFTIWDKEAENTILPFIRASILLNAPKALASVNPDRPFDESSPSVATLLEERRVVIRGFNRTIMKDTRSTIAAGIQGGENVSQIKNRIEGVFGFKDRNRALRIARTETIWALNAGAVEGYKQSGVVSGLEWSTAEDERVCQWCGPMDGKIVSIDQDFWKMGDTMTGREGGKLGFETSNIGHPPLHPQCRCALIPVAKEV